MNKKKKGLSNIVTAVILVFVALGLIVTLYSLIFPLIKSSSKKVNEDILNISNKLVSSLKDRFKLGADISENERLLYGVSKQLQKTALSLTSSMEKRNNLSVKSKELAKEIEKLESNQ